MNEPSYVVEITRYYGDQVAKSIVYRGTESQCHIYADSQNEAYQSTQWEVRPWI